MISKAANDKKNRRPNSQTCAVKQVFGKPASNLKAGNHDVDFYASLKHSVSRGYPKKGNSHVQDVSLVDDCNGISETRENGIEPLRDTERNIKLFMTIPKNRSTSRFVQVEVIPLNFIF